MAKILVTSYPTPDIDGVACIYAYAEFLNRTGADAAGAVFGAPDEEAVFLLDELGVELPEGSAVVDGHEDIVLVDACNLGWIADEIDTDQIVEIIDHREDNLTDDYPGVESHIEMVGAAATLIAEKFREKGTAISDTAATLLYTAVIDNTLDLQANVTTPRDRDMAEWCRQHGANTTLVDRVFEIKSDPETTVRKTVESDYYTTSYGDNAVGVAQLEMMEAADFVDRNTEDIVDALRDLKERDEVDYCFLTSADITGGKNVVIAADTPSQQLLAAALGWDLEDLRAEREGMLLRKEIMPRIKEELAG